VLRVRSAVCTNVAGNLVLARTTRVTTIRTMAVGAQKATQLL
jgi:hypothetical protein